MKYILLLEFVSRTFNNLYIDLAELARPPLKPSKYVYIKTMFPRGGPPLGARGTPRIDYINTLVLLQKLIYERG